jgi:hypothetical protein
LVGCSWFFNGLLVDQLEKPEKEFFTYQVFIFYEDYSTDWYDSLNPSERTCVDNYVAALGRGAPHAPTDACEMVVEDYRNQVKVAKRPGEGKAILQLQEGARRLEGILAYLFPKETRYVAIALEGEFLKDGSMSLRFDQPPRLVQGSDGDQIREGGVFEVDAQRSESNTYSGPLRVLGRTKPLDAMVALRLIQ